MMNPTQPINILFVLHDKTLENRLRKLLLLVEKEPEWHAGFVSSGQAAISHLKNSFPVQIVFTELSLPLMNGLSLLRQIQTEYPAIISVMLSPKDDYNTIRAALNRGAFDFLLLPLDPEDFRQTLKKVLLESDLMRQTGADNQKLQALEHELNIARRIQKTVISNRDPDSIRDKRVEMSGHSETARTVGGDFYDYFFLDENHLGIVIGDVAAAGLPAALFMAICRTLVRSLALQDYLPDKCLQEVNKILVRESDASIFIAVFYGILDLNNGEIVYSNGGHTYPYHVKAKGKVKLVNDPGGMVLGVSEETRYSLQKIKMTADDILFLYTDGFLSMFDEKDQAPFESYIIKYLAHTNAKKLSELVRTFFDKMYHLTNYVPIKDDITGFALKYNG